MSDDATFRQSHPQSGIPVVPPDGHYETLESLLGFPSIQQRYTQVIHDFVVARTAYRVQRILNWNTGTVLNVRRYGKMIFTVFLRGLSDVFL